MFRTRRSMLKLVGVAPFLAPAFQSVLAAGNAQPKRLVIMQRYNGAPAETWFPKSWNDFTGSSLESLNDPKLKSRLVAIKNMTNRFVDGNPNDHHAAGANSVWAARTNSSSGVSLDQYIVNKANLPTTRKNLALGVYSKGFDSITNTFYKAPGSPADINDDPYDSINRVFASFVPGMGGGGTGNDPAVVMLAKKKSILDALKDDLGRISKNVTGAEKEKLDAHLTYVRSAEMNLGDAMNNPPMPMNACKKLDPPANRYGVKDLVRLPEIAKVQNDLVTMSMACDISRIFVIQILSSYTNCGGGDVDLTWCGANIARDAQSGYVDGAGNRVLSLHQYHHATTKDTRERGIYSNINKTYASLFADLMKKLDAVPDGSGTLLDNSISVLASEYGADYTNGDTHTGTNVPYLLGGGGGGFLKTNQLFEAQAASHTQLLGTLLEYFGIEDGSGNKSGDFGDRSKGYSYASVAGLKK